MTRGGALFFRTLVEYLNHFAGRTATPVSALSDPIADWDGVWVRIGAALGLPRRPEIGDTVHFTIDGQPIDGTVFFTNEQTVGIRSDDAIYRFVEGFQPGGGGPMWAMHNLFVGGVDARKSGETWKSWLAEVVA